jgi:hypothetical protein
LGLENLVYFSWVGFIWFFGIGSQFIMARLTLSPHANAGCLDPHQSQSVARSRARRPGTDDRRFSRLELRCFTGSREITSELTEEGLAFISGLRRDPKIQPEISLHVVSTPTAEVNPELTVQLELEQFHF